MECGEIPTAGVVVGVVVEIVNLAAVVGGIYLTVGLVLAMAEAQVGIISGAPYALAYVTERVILIAFCFAVVVSAGGVGGQVVGLLCTTSDIVEMWRLLAQVIVRVLIFSTGAIVTLFAVGGSLAAQLATLAGHPNARAMAVAKVGLALFTGILTLVSVKIASVIITAVLG